MGPQVRVDNGNPRSGVEVAIAANQVVPGEVIVAAIDWRASLTPLKPRIGYWISFDAVQTFAIEGLVTPPPALDPPPPPEERSPHVDPMVVSDPRTGDFWIGGLCANKIGLPRPIGLFVARKRSGQTVLDGTVAVDVLTGPPYAAVDDKPLMAVGPDPSDLSKSVLYITFVRNSAFPCSLLPYLMFVSSSDAGATWSPPTGILPGSCPGIAAHGPVPLVLSNGRVFIAFGNRAVPYSSTRSDDRGATWLTPVPLFPGIDRAQEDVDTPGNFRLHSFLGATVDPITDTIYVVVSARLAQGSQNLDLYITRSTNRGDSFEAPVHLTLDAVAGPEGPDQIMPWIAADAFGGLNIIYYDTKHMDQTLGDLHPYATLDAYYARMINYDASTIQTFRLTPSSFNTNAADPYEDPGLPQFIGDYNGIATAGCFVYPGYMSIQVSPPMRHYYAHRVDLCPIDMDANGVVALSDLSLFLTLYALADPRADIDRDGVVTSADIASFQAAFPGGCH